MFKNILYSNHKLTSIIALLAMLTLGSCATYTMQQNKKLKTNTSTNKNIKHSIYLTGGYGDVADKKVLSLLKDELSKASENATLLFTGDNISKHPKSWEEEKQHINAQLELRKAFKGQTIFMPGNNEWESYNVDLIEHSEEYIDDLDNENVEFYPENGCPIEHQVINEDLDLILVDSKWFIANWSRIENINKYCTDIITRRRFLEELEGYINDGQNKNIIIAMHHPIFSNGKFAGNETLANHLTPLPVVGTILNLIEDLGAFDPARLESRRYNYLRIMVAALAQKSDRITVVSGHEESLQYLKSENTHQIISGSLANKTATHLNTERISTIGGQLKYDGQFTFGSKGFAKLDYFDDGSSQVTFFDENGETHTMPVLEKLPKQKPNKAYPKFEAGYKTTTILEPEETKRTRFYKTMWGERYRDYFSKEVTAPIVKLDTLYGGLKVTKKGGGHQSYSIRLEDKNGREYAMRSLRKDAIKFLKFKIPGVAFNEENYEGSLPEDIISDFFSTAHPFMQLAISPMARAVEVNHSQPDLFYVPKQDALGFLNSEFGDELYFIEERPSDEQLYYKGYRKAIDEKGRIDEFESTTDMLEKIKEDEEFSVDEESFIRARVFDMLIGDWDRHQDQWRWVEFEINDDKKTFYPVPRDRDNAFPKFDSFLMKLAKVFIPETRRFQSFKDSYGSVKWLNNGGNKLDRAVLVKLPPKAWEQQAKFIQDKLSKEVIDAAFNRLPKEVQDQTLTQIKQTLINRLETLPEQAKKYGESLAKMVAIHGTEKDDVFDIIHLKDGKTKVSVRRLLSNEKNELIYERTFDAELTKELWIYGLGDNDVFKVEQQSNPKILVRLIGGYGQDSYQIANTKKTRVYDWKHEKAIFENKKPITQLTDVYKTNTYHWRYFEENNNILRPNIGFRTDDGFYLGATNIYRNNGFNMNDFRQKHTLAANYYFKFSAVELKYQSIFANIFPKWNFEIDGYFTSDRYSTNFFGFGNETPNLEDQLGRDFYRSRLQQIKLKAGIAYHTLKIKALYESFKTKEIDSRFFTPSNINTNAFDLQHYVGGETSLFYYNQNANDFPTKSIYFGLTGGYKLNPSISENRFGYVSFNTKITHKVIPSGKLVLSTKAEVKTNIGNNYFFYHAPSLGGNNGLRGFRDERFSGKTYFYQTSDLRLLVKRYATAVTPITIGIYGGFDYGRVWQPGEDSTKWHTSQGLGIWVGSLNFITASAGFFNSSDGNIIQVGLGFDF